MTPGDERAAIVVLLRTGPRPWVEYAELVEAHGSATAVLKEELADPRARPDTQISLFPDDPTTADAPATAADARTTPDDLLDQARADLERWDARGMRLVTVLDPDYPQNLRAVHDRPPILFIAGHLTPADARAVAVVGARKATPAGIDTATNIAGHLVANGFTVLSGLAAGIDTAAHTAALARDGRTVAVIGTGLARSYPPQNAALQATIAERYAVISQFWPDSPPSRRSFPMRNAVMSGIALATVVVEASQTSGARMQARLALAQGRPVFLLASLVEQQAWARDCASRPGSHIVSEPREITNILEPLIGSDSLVA